MKPSFVCLMSAAVAITAGAAAARWYQCLQPGLDTERGITSGTSDHHSAEPEKIPPAGSESAAGLSALVDPRHPARSFNRLQDALKNTSAETLRVWIAELDAGNSPNDQRLAPARAALCSRLAALNDQEALATAMTHPEALSSGLLVERAAAELVRAERKAGEASIPANDKLADAWLRGLLTAWLAKDTDAAWQYAQNIPHENLRRNAMGKCLRRTAVRDPAKALTWVRESREYSAEILGIIARHLARVNEEGALAEAETLPSEHRRAWIDAVFAEFSVSSPQRAAALLSSMPLSQERTARTSSAAMELAEHDPAAAVEWLAHFPVETVGAELSEAMKKWIDSDVTAACAWLRSHPLKERKFISQIALHLLSEVSAEAGLEILGKMPEGPIRENLNSNFCTAWAQRDPEECVQFLANHPEVRKGVASDELAGWWADRDVSAAATWLRSQEAGKRFPAYHIFLLRGSWRDPLAAAATADSLLRDPEMREPDHPGFLNGLRGTANALTETGPVAAATWALNLPSGEARRTSLSAVSTTWSELDPVGASEWMATLPASPDRDNLVLPLVRKIAYSDPERARQWALTVQNESNREEMLRLIDAGGLPMPLKNP